MGNIPSAPPVPRPVPVPIPIPVKNTKKNFKNFKDWSGKHVEKVINEYLIL
jgi:hypothetical protein